MKRLWKRGLLFYFAWFLLVLSFSTTCTSVAAEEEKKGKDKKKVPVEFGKLSPKQAEWFIKKWESPKRAPWQLPEEIVEELGLKPGQVVADIGSGGGYFAVRMAREVGAEGKVYAVDVEKKFLDSIGKRIAEEKITNVELIHSKLDDPLLPKNSLDVIFICDTWHHIGGRESYIWKLYKALKPDGRMAVIDFRYQQPLVKILTLEHRIPRSETLKVAQENGFKLHAEYFFLPRQYFLIFKKVLFPKD